MLARAVLDDKKGDALCIISGINPEVLLMNSWLRLQLFV